MNLRIPRVQPGDEFTADRYNALVDGLKRCRLSVAHGNSSGLELDTGAGGNVLSFSRSEWFWIDLTARSGNAYAWSEVIPQAGGSWVSGFRSGTTSVDPAAEINGDTSFTLPQRVYAWRELASNEVLFQIGAC